jgi:hypothetical protein
MPKITDGTNKIDGIQVRWVTDDALVGMALWLPHLCGVLPGLEP